MQNNIPGNFPATLDLKLPPFAHQAEVLGLSWEREYFALLMEMGTGKTKVVIDNIAALAYTGKIDGALILAPKGVYMNWVRDEIPIHMPDQIDYYVGVWKSYLYKNEVKKFEAVLKRPEIGTLDIMVMNIEALSTARGFRAAETFLENHTAMMVIDESTCIKTHTAERSKKAYKLAAEAQYRRIMTGTPITQGPLDAFGQFQFLKLGCLRFTSFSAFRAYYAEMKMLILGTRSFPRIAGYRNLDQLSKDMAPHSYRKLKTECLDLPPKVYQNVYFEMSPEQRAKYEQMKKMAMIQLQETTISVTSALTLMMKLQQMTCGHITDENGVTHDFDDTRLCTLEDTVENIPGKIIIWAVFRRDVERIVEMLRRVYGDDSAVHYYGATTDEERQEAIQKFRNTTECRFFVGTCGTGGMGITLVESSVTIYYSNGYNLLHRLQSEDRNHRIGQVAESVTVIDIVCEDSVDPKIVKVLRAKKDMASLILDNWKTFLEDDIPMD